MTGMELSTAARYGLNPIVIVLNNFGYGTERQMQDGAYNDVLLMALQPAAGDFWRGAGVFVVETEAQLDQALKEAWRSGRRVSVCWTSNWISIDRSPALQRLAERLAIEIVHVGVEWGGARSEAAVHPLIFDGPFGEVTRIAHMMTG